MKEAQRDRFSRLPWERIRRIHDRIRGGEYPN
jgi:hypothetical protein